MAYDYFYGQQSEQFSFYRIPKILFSQDKFWNVSTDAKLLYGILLDRMNLSAKNGRLDELEKKAELIERKRQGLGKPNLIYVKNFISESVERQFLNCQNDNSATFQNTIQDLSKAQGNNTDIKNTDLSDTNSIFPSDNCGKENGNEEYQQYYQYFYEQLGMEYLQKDYPYDVDRLENILELVVETVCSKRQIIRIGGDDRPIEVVKSRFMKLDSEHIRYVLDCFKENTTKIRNIRQYILASLYNAPTTIGSYFDALVRHDMAQPDWGGEKNWSKLKLKREE